MQNCDLTEKLEIEIFLTIKLCTYANVVYNAYTGRLCRFRYERFYLFLDSVHGDTRRETQFLKVYAKHTMLT